MEWVRMLTFGGILLDGRFLNNRFPDSNSVSWRLLGSFTASQRYKVRRCCMKTQDVTISCRGSLYINPGGILLNGRFLHNRCPDSYSVPWRLLGSFSASHWRCMQTHHVTVSCEGGLYVNPIRTLLDGRFLHNHCSDSNSISWWLLGSLSTSQQYKIRLCHIKTQEVSVPGGGKTVAEFYSNADCSTMAAQIVILFFWMFLGSVVATQRYRVRL